MQIDMASDGSSHSRNCSISFPGNGPFSFRSVATGDFCSMLLLLFGQLRLRHRALSSRNGKGALFIRLMRRAPLSKP